MERYNHPSDFDNFRTMMSKKSTRQLEKELEATVKKGQYIGRDICRKMYNEIGKVLGFEVGFDNEDFWRFQSFCKGLAINYPQYFSYTDTLGLDNLTIK